MNASLQAFVQAVESGMCTTELASTFGLDRITVRRRAIKLGLTIQRSPKAWDKNARAIPLDFAQQCETLHFSALMRHYTASWETVKRWLKESGATPARAVREVSALRQAALQAAKEKREQRVREPSRVGGSFKHRQKGRAYNKRDIPEDFDRIAPTDYVTNIALHYSASTRTIQRWEVETGIKCKRHAEMGAPKDFAEIAPTMDARELSAKYHAHETTIRTWCKKLGVKCKTRKVPYDQRTRYPTGYMGHPERWSDMTTELYQMFMRWPAAVWSQEEWDEAYA